VEGIELLNFSMLTMESSHLTACCGSSIIVLFTPAVTPAVSWSPILGILPKLVDFYDIVPKYFLFTNHLCDMKRGGELTASQVSIFERLRTGLGQVVQIIIRPVIDQLVSNEFLYREYGRGTIVPLSSPDEVILVFSANWDTSVWTGVQL